MSDIDFVMILSFRKNRKECACSARDKIEGLVTLE